MPKVIFEFRKQEISIEYDIGDTLQNICKKFCVETQNHINSLIFIYRELNLESKFNEVFNPEDKQNLKILVYSKDYLCVRHLKPYTSECKLCYIKICEKCFFCKNLDYRDHSQISLSGLLKIINKYKDKIKKFKNLIVKFNNNIKDNNNNVYIDIIMNLKKYYLIYNKILNDINIENISYQVYQNLRNNKKIIRIIVDNLEDIINEKDKINKNKIIEKLNDKLKSNKIYKEREIILVYKTKKKR